MARRDPPVGEGFSDRVLELLQEQMPEHKAVAQAPAPVPAVPVRAYTPHALIEEILTHPGCTHAQYAAAFGRGAAWFASVLATQEFQLLLDPYREQIADPSITGTMEERFRALAMQSLAVLQDKIGGKEVSDFLVVKAVEISTKALGMGNLAPPPTSQEQQPTGAEAVAARIMEAMAKQKAAARNAQAVDVEVVSEVRDGG